MSRIPVVKDKWPVVQVSFPEKYNLSELRAFHDEIRQLVSANRRYLALTDLRQNALPETPEMLEATNDFEEEINDRCDGLCVAAALLVSSRVIQLALHAAYQLQGPPYDYAFFTDEDEAWEYLRQKRTEYGLV
jgi:hypothetical protein